MLYGLKKSLKDSSVVKGAALCFLCFALPYTLNPSPSFAGEGTTAANFLKVTMSAREAALAGAYSALADDSNAIFSNPAALASVEKSEMSLGFTSYIQDSKMGLLSFAGDFKDARFGAGMSALTISGIERRGLTDTAGLVGETGDFNSTDMAVFLSYAKKDALTEMLDNLDWGVNFKLIRSKLDDSSALAYAADLGFLYHYSGKMKISLALFNLGTKVKYEDEGDNLPLDLKAGVAYKYSEKTNLVAEVNEYIYDEKFYPSLGIEHFLRDGFALRAGYKFGYDTSNLGTLVGVTAGFGMNVSGVGFNYAYVPFGDLGNIHRFDFRMKF